ncbi:predicted protein [Naegleria gruberi]|uniref:Predicted protein n=1 Tax=Naegleria gruberi TaxID=5762 RepID=D2VY99_NAEGR|nr:uncharacterized protein NAEGRDRAFT_81691 [Naegleria gruberi]EFC38164.1 predicted protein [Naegleria gruberi]|eukprot:XP_002670908.1 predicted protein [Naegleria gruberi strain NEG-M]
MPKEDQKFVVSYGLYGGDPKYTTGAIRNAELVRYIYPGWVCRFYHDNTVPKNVLTQLEELGAELINVANDGMSGGIGGMFWRFLVAGDETVDRYIVRDSDSRLNAREAAAVEEWIESGYPVHSMRDHLGHDAPMNGGMWGGVKGAIPDIIAKIKAWPNRDQFWMDMNFLAKDIWPLIKDKTLSHDSVVCTKYPNSKSFPTRRIAKEHVGQVFDALESPRLGDMNDGRMDTPSPMACRRKPEWTHG